MTNTLALVLSVALNAAATNTVSLPREVKTDYRDIPMVKSVKDFDARMIDDESNITSTYVMKIDFDGDGIDEWMVCDGSYGSGGEGWHVFRKNENEWHDMLEVFGNCSFIKCGKGHALLVENPLGWDEAHFEYFEWNKKSFVKCLSFQVTYAKPDTNTLRTKPIGIKFKYF